MIATLFGDIDYDERDRMQQWLAAHDTEHRLLRRVITTKYGGVIQAGLLSTQPDDDWMGRHGIAHLGFERYYAPNSTAPAVTLLQSEWRNENDFYDWHQRHNLIHQILRQQLGIYGSN